MMKKALFTAATILLIGSAALAASVPYQIKLQESPLRQTEILPEGFVNIVEFVNTSAAPIRVRSVSSNIDVIVPANSSRNIRINTADLPERRLVYIVGESASQSMASAATGKSSYKSSIDLSNIINYSTAYSEYKKGEPQYESNQMVERQNRAVKVSEPVKGYW